jgi:5,10-methylenetetrahydromethanopterin reductase
MDALERGAKKAGRSIDDIDRPQLVICSVDHDRKRALDGARKMMTQYLGQQPHLMKASGVSQTLLDEIHQVLTWPATEEEIENAMHLVPDDVVQMCTASGSAEEVRAKVREYIDNGATCPILYPLGDARLMIDIFSEGYSA